MLEVEKGSVPAAKEIRLRFDKLDLAFLSDRMQSRGKTEPKAKPLGKKEQQQQAAHKVDGKFAPPPPPRTVN